MDVKHYINAARLRTLPLSVSGIIVGSFIAAAQGYFNWQICVLALLTTIGFQIISNFANDYGDGVKGTDNDNRIGPKRAIQSGLISPKAMKKAILLASVITFFVALLLILVSFGTADFLNISIFFVLGVASIIAAIRYTVGNKAYGYKGYGDLYVFIFFGLLSVVGSNYLYTKFIDFTVFLPAFSIGLLSTGVLNLNNMRDRDSDVLSNKNTLVVKIGLKNSRYYHLFLIVGSFLFAVMYTFLHFETIKQFIFAVAFIPLTKHLVFVFKNKELKDLDPELKKLALSTFLFSLLFGIGLILI